MIEHKIIKIVCGKTIDDIIDKIEKASMPSDQQQPPPAAADVIAVRTVASDPGLALKSQEMNLDLTWAERSSLIFLSELFVPKCTGR